MGYAWLLKASCSRRYFSQGVSGFGVVVARGQGGLVVVVVVVVVVAKGQGVGAGRAWPFSGLALPLIMTKII